MMLTKRIFHSLVFAGLALSFSARGLDYSPKMLVRSGAGMISNSAATGGTITIGGINVLGQLFLTDWLSAGVGFRADFDLANGVVPLKGFDLQGRVYFLGKYTQARTEDPGRLIRSRRSLFAAYLLGEFALRSYVFPVQPGISLEGGVEAVNFGAGLDYALSRHFEFNIEATMGVFNFASDPARVKLQMMSMSYGLGYLF